MASVCFHEGRKTSTNSYTHTKKKYIYISKRFLTNSCYLSGLYSFILIGGAGHCRVNIGFVFEYFRL